MLGRGGRVRTHAAAGLTKKQAQTTPRESIDLDNAALMYLPEFEFRYNRRVRSGSLLRCRRCAGAG